MTPRIGILAVLLPLTLAACGGSPSDAAPVIDASASSVYADGKACQTPRFRNCAFYSACLEAERPCGSEGYALGYGEKYCNRFKNQTRLSERGSAWRDATMLCLQQRLTTFVDGDHTTSCNTVIDSAFDSHPACYTQPGHSICSLPATDIWTILQTLDGTDALSLRFSQQIRSILATCVEQIGPTRVSLLF